MDFNRIALFVNTIKYLKFKQIIYRFIFVFKKYFICLNFRNKNFKTSKIIWRDYIYKNREYLGSNKFRILNITLKFANHIDWNYLEFGKLWTYHLNYFAFLNQKGISKHEALRLINNYVDRSQNLNYGKDSYPISLRGLNWIKFLSKNNIQNTRIDNFLYNDYNRLFNNFEYHLLGNHLLENAFSLFFASIYFKKNKFKLKAIKVLKAELEEQILDDGSHFELSSTYHIIIFERLLDTLLLIKLNNYCTDIYPFLFKKASLMWSYLNKISFKNGDIPLLNDSIYNSLSLDKFKMYCNVLNIKNSNIKLSQSGYRKWEFNDFELLFDIGEIGPSYIPGHAHADTFNFILYYKNNPLIIDIGVSTYDISDKRNFEKSTLGHNTISINGKNSSEIWSSFRVGDRASVEIVKESKNKIIASHNGYRKIKAKHSRTFEKNKSTFKVLDEIVMKKNDKAYSSLYFDSKCNPTIGNNIVSISDLRIILINHFNIKLEKIQIPDKGFNSLKNSYRLVSQVKINSSISFKKV